MKIEDAKNQIKELEEYIKLIDSYDPENMEQEAIKSYVLHENVTNVTKELNKKGYRIGERKLVTTDVSSIIKSKPKDRLHEMANKMFKRNRRGAQKRGWL